jgi:hypothetical protein
MHSCPFREPPIYPLSNMTSKTAFLTEAISAQRGGKEVNRPKDTPGRNASDDYDIPILDPGRLPIPEECVDNWTAENATDLNSANYLTDKDLAILVWGVEQVRNKITSDCSGEKRRKEKKREEDVESDCDQIPSAFHLHYYHVGIDFIQLYNESHHLALLLLITLTRLHPSDSACETPSELLYCNSLATTCRSGGSSLSPPWLISLAGRSPPVKRCYL